MKQSTNNREVRSITAELRAAAEGRTVEGYAALFNQVTDLGWFREVIMPGAFDSADTKDVRALFNHDPNNILARTASKTMRLEVDERGLKYTFEAPNTTLGNDLLEMIRRGDISQSSFAFKVEKTTWVEEKDMPELRQIEKIETVFDVSPVTYPAYTTTTVQARSLEQVKAEEHPDHPPPPDSEDAPDGADFQDEFEKQQQELKNRLTVAAGDMIHG